MGYYVYLEGELRIYPPLDLVAVKTINDMEGGEIDATLFSGIPNEHYGVFRVNDEGTILYAPDESGKYNVWVEWVEFLLRTFIVADGRTVEGEFHWDGDESDDQGVLKVVTMPGGRVTIQSLTPPTDTRRWDASDIKEMVASTGQAATFPIPFAGNDMQRGENLRSHKWGTVDDEGRECSTCTARDWHQAAYYPCLAEVPTRTVLL